MSSPVTPLNKMLIQSLSNALEVGLQALADHNPDNHKIQDACTAGIAAINGAVSAILAL